MPINILGSIVSLLYFYFFKRGPAGTAYYMTSVKSIVRAFAFTEASRAFFPFFLLFHAVASNA